MHPFVHKLISKSLINAQGFATRLTDKSRIESLIRSLWPLEFKPGLIRLGPPSDGGYLVPDDLDGIAACFSPGVESLSGFEMGCAKVGMQVFMADNSVSHPAESHERFHFTRKHLGVMTDESTMTLDDWVSRSLPDASDLLLQIDIEGAEYEVFLGASDALMRRFRIIVAEFHALDQLWNEPFFNLISSVFGKILQSHHCIHIHPNNHSGRTFIEGLEIPAVMEFTFLRTDRMEPSGYVTAFPHLLDRDNAARPPLPLPQNWWGFQSIDTERKTTKVSV